VTPPRGIGGKLIARVRAKSRSATPRGAPDKLFSRIDCHQSSGFHSLAARIFVRGGRVTRGASRSTILRLRRAVAPRVARAPELRAIAEEFIQAAANFVVSLVSTMIQRWVVREHLA